jgi:hypothetical protein
MPDTQIRLPLGITGWTVYTRLKNEAGNIWQTTTSTFVPYVVANVANYALATPETPAGSGDYEATMPVGSAAGKYSWAHYRQMGGAAAISDPLAGNGGDTWDGTSFGAAAGGASVADIFAKPIGGGTFEEAILAQTAVAAGRLTQSSDGTADTFHDFKDPTTPRVTSTSTPTERTVTIL